MRLQSQTLPEIRASGFHLLTCRKGRCLGLPVNALHPRRTCHGGPTVTYVLGDIAEARLDAHSATWVRWWNRDVASSTGPVGGHGIDGAERACFTAGG